MLHFFSRNAKAERPDATNETRPASVLAPLPYFAAFIAAPLAILAGRLSDRAALGQTFGLLGLAPWLALAGFAVLASLWSAGAARSRKDRPAWPSFAAGVGLAALAWALWRVLLLALPQAEDYAPLLDELRLPALIAFSGLWAWSFGAPRRESLAYAGAGLGALMVLDFLLTAITAHGVVPGGGLLFGDAPGTPDMLGFLLCLALCATVDDRAEPGVPRLARWLILAGLLASGSRISLAVGALLCLVFERGPLRGRLLMALACALAVWISMVLPLQRAFQGDELTLDWYYAATVEALRQDPAAIATGLALDTPLAIALPDSMSDFQGLLGDADSDGLPVSVHQIPSSTLRLLAGWGAGALALVFGAAIFCAVRGRKRFGYALLAVLALIGSAAPVLHVPATAAAAALAFVSAARRPAPGETPETEKPEDAGEANTPAQ